MSLSESNNDINMPDLDSLIETLKSKDGLARQHARHALVKIGEPALDALMEAFAKKGEPMHWEVAKALSQIGTAKAAQTLVEALEDKEFSIRWIAAEGLIHIGKDALIPLLEALMEKPDSIWLREGGHHVIHDLVSRKSMDEETRGYILPVLDALNHVQAQIETHSAAKKALELLISN